MMETFFALTLLTGVMTINSYGLIWPLILVSYNFHSNLAHGLEGTEMQWVELYWKITISLLLLHITTHGTSWNVIAEEGKEIVLGVIWRWKGGAGKTYPSSSPLLVENKLWFHPNGIREPLTNLYSLCTIDESYEYFPRTPHFVMLRQGTSGVYI